MDLLIVIYSSLFCVIEAALLLRASGVHNNSISKQFKEESPSQVVAFLILEDNDNTKKSEKSFTYHQQPHNLNLWNSRSNDSDYNTDSSGDSNADEYPDTDEIDTDNYSNYYHEDDYADNIISISEQLEPKANTQDESQMLRKRWKSCRKAGSKACKDACVASYKNSCDYVKCGSKLKKYMKKECKRNCKEYFG